MTRPTRKPRRRSENVSPRHVVISGSLVAFVALAVIWFGYQSVSGVPGVKYQTLYADVPDVSNLATHDEVRVAGVRVGQILGTGVKNGRALLKVQLQPGTGRLRADSTVVVRARGLLGSRYLELRPGRSGRLLNEGDTLRAPAVTSLTSGVADVLDTFDEETRGGLGDLLGETGQGLSGRGEQLNDVIRIGPDVTEQLTRVTKSIENRPGAARRLVPSLASGMAALDGAREEFAGFLGAGADGLTPFIDARDAMQDTLEAAPSTLAAMRSGLGAGRSLVGSVGTLSRSLNTALPAAPAGLRAANALLRESPAPLRRSLPLLDELRPAIPSVLKVTDALAPNLTPLRRAFDDLEPLVGSLADHDCDVANFGDNWRSVLGYGAPSQRALPGGDAGHFNQLRVHVIAGPQSLGSLAPGISRPFVRNRTIYSPPCTHSPGRVYSALGIGADSKGSGR